MGIEEEELARARAAKKQIARPQKEKEKEAVLKGKMEQKAVQAMETEQGPAVSTWGKGPNINDNSLSKRSYGNPSKLPWWVHRTRKRPNTDKTRLTAEDVEGTDTKPEPASPKLHPKAPNSLLRRKCHPRKPWQ